MIWVELFMIKNHCCFELNVSEITRYAMIFKYGNIDSKQYSRYLSYLQINFLSRASISNKKYYNL